MCPIKTEVAPPSGEVAGFSFFPEGTSVRISMDPSDLEVYERNREVFEYSRSVYQTTIIYEVSKG